MSVIAITITNADEQLRRVYKIFGHYSGHGNKAIHFAIRRTLEGIRTDAARETHKRYFISYGEVLRSMRLKWATQGDLDAAVTSYGRRKKLSDYKLTPKSTDVQHISQKRFRAAVMRKGGLKKLDKGTFLLRRSYGYNLYYRAGKGRYDIKSYISPAIPQIMSNAEIVQIIQKNARERFEKRITHEIYRALELE